MKFEELGLHESILEAISYMGFETATPIQEKAIPLILEGRDLIACAQTGTGKTAAFVLPILHKLAVKNDNTTNTLIIVPTRELAIQIDQQIQGFSYFVNADSATVYGGGDAADWDKQKRALTKGGSIIVATPGKLLAHLQFGYVKFDSIQHLILDEADRMMDMGFVDDILKIISYLPKKRQNLMFSATMAPKIRKLMKEILHEPEEITISLSKPAEGVLQAAYLAYNEQKIPLISSLIADKPNYERIIIFSSTKRKVNDIVRGLSKKGFDVEGISSDLEQKEREEVLLRFRARQTRVLVATDVLSRGIDIKDINLIINFDAPHDAEDYVHRVGRTARAGGTGVALTLINPDDMYRFRKIEKLIGKEIMKLNVPSELGESPKYGKGKPKKYGGRSKQKSGYKRKR